MFPREEKLQVAERKVPRMALKCLAQKLEVPYFILKVHFLEAPLIPAKKLTKYLPIIAYKHNETA
jgi:hypothetical protein